MAKSGLEVELCGLQLGNPLILASGILGVTAETMLRVRDSGAAAVVTKSVGSEPRLGHRNPTCVDLPHGLINAMGLPNPGIDDFVTELDSLKGSGLPVIGSVFGGDEQEYARLAQKMIEHGAAGIELNLSCPHAKGLGLEMGSTPDMVERVVSEVTNAIKEPVFAKLTPHTPNLVALGRAAKDAGAAGIVAVNTIRAMSIDIDSGRPVLGNRIGGYSGPAMKPIAVRAVYELASELDIPIVGVGGVTTGEDVVEFMMAGAQAVQVGSAVFYRGIDVFNKINNEILEFIESHDYSNINKIIGISLE